MLQQQVLRVVDGGEPTLFKQYFATWKEPVSKSKHSVPTSVPVKDNKIAGILRCKYNEKCDDDIDLLKKNRIRHKVTSS